MKQLRGLYGQTFFTYRTTPVYLLVPHMLRGVDRNTFTFIYMNHIKNVDYAINIITHFGLYWRRTAFFVR